MSRSSSTSSSLNVKVIIVTRRTRFEELVAQYNTEAQAAFVISSKGGDFDDYRVEHSTYLTSVETIKNTLKKSARLQMVERNFLPNFIFGPEDIVVVIGQDGLVANTLKYLNGQPVIAINPDPSRFDGVLLPFAVADIGLLFADVLRKQYQSKYITMAKATLNDGQELIAVNDIFIGPRSHTSARYALTVNQQTETQSSSGIIVSTGLGSTGWMKSIIAGATGILGKNSTSGESNTKPLAWDTDHLQFAVREPFPSNTTGTDLVYGKVSNRSNMSVSSLMSGNGVIFSDGMIDDFVEFNSGAEVKLGIAENRGNLLV
ncbi:MAG: NAD kinase [Kiritimatiellia bacterium]|jgi:NAD kinase